MSEEDDKATREALVDAIARGRVALAEAAGITTRELDAWYALACLRLDTGRDEDAVILFAGLVTMFPYAAKYWRGYGIALHSVLALKRALAAYDVALALEPDNPFTLLYRAEVLLYIGRVDEALVDIERIAAGDEATLHKRAHALLSFMSVKANQEAIALALAEEPAIPELQTASFELADGRPLPLNDSIYDAADAARATDQATAEDAASATPFGEEITARLFVSLEDLPTPERTETAVIPGRPGRGRPTTEPPQATADDTQTAPLVPIETPSPTPAPLTQTQTAEVVRPGVVPRRRTTPMPVVRSATQLRRDGTPLTDEITLTHSAGLAPK